MFVARQPIYDRSLRVFAYELLYRNALVDEEAGELDERNASEALLNAFIEIGLDRVASGKPAFINLSRDLIVGRYALSFPKDRVVLEVLENVTVDAELLDAVRELSARGYRIALDDFTYREELRPLVELADIVKLDVLATGRMALQSQMRTLRPMGVKLLAEKIESQADFDFCKSAEFDYFQGHFFCRPKVIAGRRIPGTRIATLELLGKLRSPIVSLRELEEVIRRDVSISYRLLRCINSAYYALPTRIESLRQAILLLGTEIIISWVSLIALAGIDDKPRELVVSAMIRGKMCEHLAIAMNEGNPEKFFTVGLFSVLDALLDMPMQKVIESLPLSDDINAALLDPKSEGPLGHVLRCVLAYESGKWESVTCGALRAAAIRKAYLDAVDWATDTGTALAA